MSLADRLKAAGLNGPPPEPLPFVARPEILLHPRIPTPMSGVAPRVVLGRRWWDETRRAAYRAAQYRCLACGVIPQEVGRGPLEGHELYKIDFRRGRMTYVETVALCSWCHSFIHDGRTRAMMHQGKITALRYVEIMNHGRSVLRAAKVKKRTPSFKEIAPWKKWRMVLDGKEYPPTYASYEDFLKHVGHRLED